MDAVINSLSSNSQCTIKPPPPPRQYCKPALFSRQPGQSAYAPLSVSYGSSVSK